MDNKTIVVKKCSKCKEEFVIRKNQLEYYSDNNRSLPKHCPDCARKYRAEKAKLEKEKQDLLWAEQKRKEKEQFEKAANENNIVDIADIHIPEEASILNVFGNGFDLMHGVKSSYNSFQSTLGKNSNIRHALESYLLEDDLWSNFENALSRINVEGTTIQFMIDDALDYFDAYDEDAGAAEFFCAVDYAIAPIITITSELDKRFEGWVKTLKIGTNDKPLKSIIGNRLTLSFNYTEFSQTVYNIDNNNICYIHGCRKNKDKLILGHQPGASDKQYSYKDHKPLTYRKGKEYETLLAAQEYALRMTANYDDFLTKHCDEIIKEHKAFFEKTKAVDTIIVIGHSLASVDWDYFEEIISLNKKPKSINWYIGCHNVNDFNSIKRFIKRFKISPKRVVIFRTDTISVSLLPESKDSKAKSNGNISAPKKLCESDDKSLSVFAQNNKLQIVDSNNYCLLSHTYSNTLNYAFFCNADSCLLVFSRAYPKGIMLYRKSESNWILISELVSAHPVQDVINSRLKQAFINDKKLTLVYNNRVVVYSLNTGEMIKNYKKAKAPTFTYDGTDITKRFLNR